MPGLAPGIHAIDLAMWQDVDGRDEPGHDGLRGAFACRGVGACGRTPREGRRYFFTSGHALSDSGRNALSPGMVSRML
jgi:hypothetical protein